MIGVADPGRAETDLAAGLLTCPSCAGPLQPWGHARTRTVRDHGTTTWPCDRDGPVPHLPRTHVLLPAVVAPRRADTTAVIGAALQASARGTGTGGSPRAAAGRCPRCGAGSAPSATRTRRVAARPGVAWLARVDLDVLAGLTPQPTRLGEALTALAAAALTLRARVVPHVPPWTLIGQITLGRLVSPPVPTRPG